MPGDAKENGGRGGIRTPVGLTAKPDFESGTFNHSATLPLVYLQALTLALKDCH